MAFAVDESAHSIYEYTHKTQISEDKITSIAYSQKGKYLIAGTNKVCCHSFLCFYHKT